MDKKLIKVKFPITKNNSSRLPVRAKQRIAKKQAEDYNLETGIPVSNLSIPEIMNDKEFKEILDEINIIMNKGDYNLTASETKRLRLLSLAVRNYDRRTYSIERPKTLGAILDFQKYQRGWKQIQMACALGVSEAKLSLQV